MGLIIKKVLLNFLLCGSTRAATALHFQWSSHFILGGLDHKSVLPCLVESFVVGFYLLPDILEGFH